jgi:hypothetical protein
MKDHPATVAAKTLGLIAAFGFAIPIMAQQGSPRPPNDVDPARARFEDTSKREMQLRGLGNMPKAPADPKQLQALMAQVQQDFERILTIHNEIVHKITTNSILVADFVSDASAEIRKRATRLQTTLAFEKPDASEQNRDKWKQLNEGQMKEALVTLCKHIESFITNPIIKTPGTIDAEQSARARRDLEYIVQLSGNIKKTADSLSKTRK